MAGHIRSSERAGVSTPKPERLCLQGSQNVNWTISTIFRHSETLSLDYAGRDLEGRDRHLYGNHVKFLIRYGDLIRRVRICGYDQRGEIKLRWFPRLEMLTLAGDLCFEVSKESIGYAAGVVDTMRLLDLFFNKWYEQRDCSWNSFEPRGWSRYMVARELTGVMEFWSSLRWRSKMWAVM